MLAAAVPGEVARLTEGIGVAIDTGSPAKLEETCRARATLARQPKRVASARHLSLVTRESFQEAVLAHGFPSDRFGSAAEIFVEDDDAARALLGMFDGRYYESDFSGEHRRGDRY